MKLFRMACGDLIDPDPLGHELFKVRHHLIPTQDALDTSPNRIGFFVRNLAQVNGCGESRQGAKLAKDQTKHPQKGSGTNGGVFHFKNQPSSLDNHPSSDGKAAGDGYKPRTEFRAESKKGKEHWLLALVFSLTRFCYA